jgi:hypothetical protein
MWHIWWAGEIHRGFWWGDLREIVLQECQGIDGGNIKMDYKVSLGLD